MTLFFQMILSLVLIFSISPIDASRRSEDNDAELIAFAARRLLNTPPVQVRSGAHSAPMDQSIASINPNIFTSSSISLSRRRNNVITPSSSHLWDEKEPAPFVPTRQRPCFIPIDPNARRNQTQSLTPTFAGRVTPILHLGYSASAAASRSATPIDNQPNLLSQLSRRFELVDEPVRADEPVRVIVSNQLNSALAVPVARRMLYNSPVNAPIGSANISDLD